MMSAMTAFHHADRRTDKSAAALNDRKQRAGAEAHVVTLYCVLNTIHSLFFQRFQLLQQQLGC